ncbi:hypothetical protein ANCCEY_10613 [Ancylostoma ceylanicum]|uniref:Uncharacterized protein n=1 Tax=Ancylostoma ceylanicum TaxID=53326 RepID=A0A0D6LJY8_9BILA|nr:hypothetical protein ANCCEY_10613 [Ancylostoma ceylanicum]
MSANARSFGGTKMARKAGGLAAIMAGQPVVQHKRTIRTAIKAVFRSSGLHIGLVITCMIYIYLGAIIFRYLEHPHEIHPQQASIIHWHPHMYIFVVGERMTIEIREETSLRFEELQQRFLRDVEEMKDTLDDDEYGFNATLDVLINNYLEELFKSFDNPIARNYFDSLFYNEGEYVDLWTMDASVLFTATTMVPSTTIFMAALLMLLLLYPLVGGVCIHNVSHLSLFDMDVIATNIIHQIHYMGRQMGKAKVIADKMIQIESGSVWAPEEGRLGLMIGEV